MMMMMLLLLYVGGRNRSVSNDGRETKQSKIYEYSVGTFGHL